MTTESVQSNAGIPGKLNLSLALLYAVLHLYQFFFLPARLLPSDARWAWTLLPLALLNNPHWSLLHEAIHDMFHDVPRVNALFGRLLSVMFGAPFRILRLSHLLHHKLNRMPIEATEIYDREKVSAKSAAPGYYFQILGGLYLVELLSPLLFFLPRRFTETLRNRFVKPQSVSGILLHSWSRKAAVREIRTDGIIIVGWLAVSFYCYGHSWPLLVAVLAARAFFISFLDNVYHYRTPVGEIFYAKNLRLPVPAAGVLLNFNLHGIHHQHPTAPWTSLPALFRADGARYQGSYFSAAARQLLGPVAIQDLPPAVHEDAASRSSQPPNAPM
jgi:fatty acid desaturase